MSQIGKLLAVALVAALLPRAARAAPEKGKGAADVPDLPLETPAPPPAPTVVVQAPAASTHWSVISAETTAVGHDLLSAELGFPGLTVGYAHALSDQADWGVKADLLYGLFNTTEPLFGLEARLPLRYVVTRRDRVTLLAHLDPGVFVYSASKTLSSQLGVQVTPGAALGFQVDPQIRLAVGFDLPITVQVLHGADVLLGPLFGFGVEFYADKSLCVGLNLRFGPVFVPTSTADSRLGFVSQITVGYRL